ncbi:MAG TPA: peroxiredoxin [Steroidobacteraceae bacterium]
MADKTVQLDRKVPEFSLPATGGDTWKLSGAAGRKLIIYFYPRDNTSGCTSEGMAFRGLYPQFRKAKADIVGVSTDTLASHEKFKAKFEFPFELLADEERKACRLFDVIREKSMYGRKFMGVVRSTFLLDEKGVLRREWRKVRVNGHAEAVLDAVREI